MDTPTSMDGLVEAYDTTSGRKTRVPAEWIGDPIVGRNLRRTPLQVAADAAAGERPTEDWTKTQLEAFAADQGIKVPEGALKADVWSAVEAVLVEGDRALTVASTPPAGPVSVPAVVGLDQVDAAPYVAQIEQQAALIADLEQRFAEALDELEALTSPDADTTATADTDLDTPTEHDTTDTPAAGDEE